MFGPPTAPWSSEIARCAALLEVDLETGLAEDEPARRRARFGANALRRIEARGALHILGAQLKSAIVALLAVGAAISVAFGQHVEGAAIAAVIVLNTALGFFTELRAVRSMEALRALGEVTTKVRRAGRPRAIAATELVPGDVVLVEAGDVISADLRVTEASALAADESALTGESVPVDKSGQPTAEDASLAERTSMLFKGTTITRGTGEGVVVGTGMETELGRISALVEEADDQDTPLERRIAALSRQLGVVSLGFVALATGLGIARGESLLLMLQSAVALAVATVPEGLPVVATIALARGMWRMARRNVLVERLSAVETLGSTSLVLTDKTGTLTENRLRAAELVVDAEAVVLTEAVVLSDRGPTSETARRLIETAVLASDAVATPEPVGDPIDVALVALGEQLGVRRAALLDETPELCELAFDPRTKLCATEHRTTDGVRIAVKGAPEAVLARCSHALGDGGATPLDPALRERWRRANEAAAARGLRVIAVATRDVDRALTADEAYAELTLLGLVGLLDPPRPTVKRALDAARDAGVRVVVATGDQAPTAAAVATAVGLAEGATLRVMAGDDIPELDAPDAKHGEVLSADVIARATPAQKLRLLRLHQRAGAVVAMLGDGVNDAPALQQADIGVAMGKRGTQVARQAADMVLEDDELGSVVVAIEQGRVIFQNLRAFVVYLLGCNLAEIFVIGVATTIGWPLPILPLQILFLNLVTDVFPALALGVGEGDPSVMRAPPRAPNEAFLTRRHWSAIGAHAAALTLAVLIAYGLGLSVLGLDVAGARTMAFATLGFGQVWHVFDMADPRAPLLRNDVTRNRFVWGAVGLCVGLILTAVLAPGLRDLLSAAPIPAAAWASTLALSVLPLTLIQAARTARRRSARAARA